MQINMKAKLLAEASGTPLVASPASEPFRHSTMTCEDEVQVILDKLCVESVPCKADSGTVTSLPSAKFLNSHHGQLVRLGHLSPVETLDADPSPRTATPSPQSCPASGAHAGLPRVYPCCTRTRGHVAVGACRQGPWSPTPRNASHSQAVPRTTLMPEVGDGVLHCTSGAPGADHHGAPVLHSCVEQDKVADEECLRERFNDMEGRAPVQTHHGASSTVVGQKSKTHNTLSTLDDISSGPYGPNLVLQQNGESTRTSPLSAELCTSRPSSALEARRRQPRVQGVVVPSKPLASVLRFKESHHLQSRFSPPPSLPRSTKSSVPDSSLGFQADGTPPHMSALSQLRVHSRTPPSLPCSPVSNSAGTEARLLFPPLLSQPSSPVASSHFTCLNSPDSTSLGPTSPHRLSKCTVAASPTRFFPQPLLCLVSRAGWCTWCTGGIYKYLLTYPVSWLPDS